MPSGYQELSPSRVVAFDDIQKQVTMVANGSYAQVLSFRTPPGLKGRITAFRQNWDAAINNQVAYSLRINGAELDRYLNSTIQIAAPEADVDLPVPIPVDQFTLVEVYARLPVGQPANNTFTARVICKYYDPLGELQ